MKVTVNLGCLLFELNLSPYCFLFLCQILVLFRIVIKWTKITKNWQSFKKVSEIYVWGHWIKEMQKSGCKEPSI